MKKISTLMAMILITCSSGMAQTFTLKSSDLGGQFVNSQLLNGMMGYTGGNISPQLSWENVPAGTQSLAVTMYDVDAPSGSGFWHWVVYNIPADVNGLKADAGNPERHLLPSGAIQGINDAGMAAYIGPGPLPGLPHQYLITVYALKSKLTLDKNTPAAFVGVHLNLNVLAKASIVGYVQHP
jgi:Raf kinase inhibitor-like YbhB/YbcL family protein